MPAGEVVRAERCRQSLPPVTLKNALELNPNTVIVYAANSSPRWVSDRVVDSGVPHYHAKFGMLDYGSGCRHVNSARRKCNDEILGTSKRTNIHGAHFKTRHPLLPLGELSFPRVFAQSRIYPAAPQLTLPDGRPVYASRLMRARQLNNSSGKRIPSSGSGRTKALLTGAVCTACLMLSASSSIPRRR
jgi:hypothetical protein